MGLAILVVQLYDSLAFHSIRHPYSYIGKTTHDEFFSGRSDSSNERARSVISSLPTDIP